jgi:hypothetical protein
MPRKAAAKPKARPEGAGPGRPSLYRDDLPERAYKLALLKLTDPEIADVLEIPFTTFNTWKAQHPEFREAIARGKTPVDAEAVVKLRDRAFGYSHEAVKIFMPAGATEPVYAPYTEHYPPDTNALSLWLRNRQPTRWRDKQDIEHSGEVGWREILEASLDKPKGGK